MLFHGPRVVILIILVPDNVLANSNKHCTLLTVKPRIAAGNLKFIDLPAGMVDKAGNFRGTAAKKI